MQLQTVGSEFVVVTAYRAEIFRRESALPHVIFFLFFLKVILRIVIVRTDFISISVLVIVSGCHVSVESCHEASPLFAVKFNYRIHINDLKEFSEYPRHILLLQVQRSE